MALDACGVEFDIAKVHAAKTNPELADYVSQGDLQKLDLPSEHWHCAMLNEVLEHVPDEPAALREVNRILKLGGTLLVFSPNRWFPFETHGVFLRNSDKRVPHWTPFIPYLPLALGKKFLRYWARNYWHGELRRLVSEAGFSIIEIGYVWQTFEGISGREPRLLRGVKPVLRQLSNSLERTPFLRAFGVSQVLVARKTESALPLDGQGQTAR
jgi:ubiquinone/menaquinone biosynthesis C-methylase UbiE